MEMALILPSLLLLIFGAIFIGIWYFKLSATAIAASSAARAGGIARGNVAIAESTNAELLGAFGVSEAAGGSEVTIDASRRAVIVRTESNFESGFSLLDYLQLELFGGSFARRWDFYPGPPDPWE